MKSRRKKDVSIRVAHFSDFHIGRASSDLDTDLARMQGLIDHAIDAGADHLLFGGDLVDHGNVDDCKALRKHLDDHGYLSADRFSFVPGNHDVWPVGEDELVTGIAKYVGGNLVSIFTGEDYPAQQNFDRLNRLFKKSFQGAESLYDESYFPAFKTVGPLGIALLDTTSDEGMTSMAAGRFIDEEGEWLEEMARAHEGPVILLMHHWPFDFTLNPVVDTNFKRLKRVQRFIRQGPWDAVLCGHVHLMREEHYDRLLGDVPVHCMGRSGGVHQDEDDPLLGYHLIDADEAGVEVETVLVEASEVT